MQSLSIRIFLLLVACLGHARFATANTIVVPNDYPTIQEAIQASLNGDTIHVLSGTYVENIIIRKKSLRIIAIDGPGFTILDGTLDKCAVEIKNTVGGPCRIEGFTIIGGDGKAVSSNGRAGSIGYVNGGKAFFQNNVCIQSPSAAHKISGAIYCQGGELYAEDNQFSSLNGTAIRAEIAKVFQVHRNLFENGRERAIEARETPNATIINNRILNQDGEGIYSFLAPNVTISDNFIEGSSWYGITVSSCRRAEVTRNIVRGGASMGIALFGTKFSRVNDNVSQDNQWYGIHVSSSGDTSIRRNRVHSNADSGMSISNSRTVEIQSNEIAGNGKHGIETDSGTVIADGNTIVSNLGDGIYVRLVHSYDILNSIIRDNGGNSIGIFSGSNAPNVSYSNLEGGFSGIGNTDVDPLFVDRDGPDNNPLTFDDNNYRLASNSPCIDSGLNPINCTRLEVGRHPRVIDGNFSGTATVDLGAHEFNHVYLEVDGIIEAGSTVTVHLTGEAGLQVRLDVGEPASPVCVATYGPVFFQRGTSHKVFQGALPASFDVVIPIQAQLPWTMQAIAFDPQNAALGNVSGPR